MMKLKIAKNLKIFQNFQQKYNRKEPESLTAIKRKQKIVSD